MNILVTGANGQLGVQFFISKRSPENKWFFTNSTKLDICDESKVEAFILQNRINLIINCAAFTNVDGAEEEFMSYSFKSNVEGPNNLSKLCKKHSVKLIHFSTDYVFSGELMRPYTEMDKLCPINMYGVHKREAEQEIMINNFLSTVIFRISGLFSEHHTNILTKAINWLNSGEVKAANNQYVTITYAKDLVEDIITLIESDSLKFPNTYHYSNQGVLTYEELFKFIVEKLGIECKIEGVDYRSFGLLANRPKYSALNSDKFMMLHKLGIRDWQEAVKDCINNLNL